MLSSNPERPAAPVGDGDAPIRVIPGRREAGLLLLCDHASNALPAEYGRLGLADPQFERHIAYDIGAAWATEAMAEVLGAPALMTTYSRLLIDPNRGAQDPTLVMQISDGAIVPGNAGIDPAGVDDRRRRFWQPYHDAIEHEIAAFRAEGIMPAIVCMHSFTPFWKGVPRPWHVGLLWDNDARLAGPLFRALTAEPDLQPWADKVGDNEPYDGALPGDTIDTHATRNGLANVLVEIRQDLIATERAAREWGLRLARLLQPILERPEIGTVVPALPRQGAAYRLPSADGGHR